MIIKKLFKYLAGYILLMMVFVFVVNFILPSDPNGWPASKATVTYFSMKLTEDHDISLKMNYEYKVNEKTYHGSKFLLIEEEDWYNPSRKIKYSKYFKGAVIPIYYNSKYPGWSNLERTDTEKSTTIVFIFLSMLYCSLIYFHESSHKKKSKDRPFGNVPVRTPKDSREKPIAPNVSLDVASQCVIAEILEHLENRGRALRGVEATITRKETVFKHGEFHVKEIHKEQQPIIGWYWFDESDDPYEILTSPKRIFKEAPCDEQNEIRIRAVPTERRKFDFSDISAADFVDTIIMNKEPPRLIGVNMSVIHMPWWLRWPFKTLVESCEFRMGFEYIRGVPAPKNHFVRIVTRGMGSWRYGIGHEVEFQYEIP